MALTAAVWKVIRRRSSLHRKCQKFSYAFENSWIQTSTRKNIDTVTIILAKRWRSVYFRSLNGCSTNPCFQCSFLYPVKSWYTQEGYKCITLAVCVQEGILFGHYFFRIRSQGVATLVSETETSRLVYASGLVIVLVYTQRRLVQLMNSGGY